MIFHQFQMLFKRLLTILLNLYKKIRNAICYPYCILPRHEYKNQFSIQQVINHNEYYLVRRSEKNFQDTFDDFGQVKISALIENYRDVPGLSMNILGGLFRPKHISFVLKGPATNPWIKNMDKHIWIKHIWYITYLKKTTPIFFKLNDIHGCDFPYHREENKDYKKLVQGMTIKPNIIDGVAECSGTSIVEHSPNKLNYWHIEFHIKSGLGNLENEPRVKTVKNKSFTEAQLENFRTLPWQDQLAFSAVNDCIIINSLHDVPLIIPIDEHIFLETA